MRRIGALLWTLALNVAVLGQGTGYVVRPDPETRLGPCCYDAARNVLVAVQQSPTLTLWEWSDDRWWRRLDPGTPAPARVEGLVYDSQRNVTVALMRGVGGTQTWQWNGVRWQQVAGPQMDPRSYPAVAYDGTRGRIVLFGGLGMVDWMPVDETWEYDGVQWTQQLPTVSPPARYGAGMAQYGNGVLLYGGRDAQQFLADTWLWDGTAWTQLPNGPPLSSLPAMATDPMGGVILVHQQQPAPPDTWRFQGGAWSQLPNTIPWGSGNTLALTEESGRVRALVAADQRLERWEWSGTAWQRNAAQVMATQDSSRPAVSPAPGGGLFQWGGTFGTLADRGYVWNGRDWQMLPQVPAPPPRAGHAIAFDARRNSVLLFGGGSSSAQFGDTWEFAAGAWTQSVTTAPTARSGHAMCYDASRGRIVLFGGSQGFTAAADTWLWDGVRWQQAAPATTPPARFQHTMAFDPATGRVWMYGGWRYSPVPVFHADTWTFDGTNWTQVAAAPMVHLAVLGHEPQRGAMMLFEVGGTRAFTWNGGWTAAPAPGEIVQAAALDSGRNRLVLVGLAGAVVELSPGPLPVVGTGSQRCGGPGVDLDLALVGEPLLGGQVRFDLRVPPPIAFLLLADAAGNTMFGPCTVVPALGQATLLVPTPNGAAAIAVSVPDAGSLLGFGVYAQGVALDASSPSGIGLAVTNDVQFVIGW